MDGGIVLTCSFWYTPLRSDKDTAGLQFFFDFSCSAVNYHPPKFEIDILKSNMLVA